MRRQGEQLDAERAGVNGDESLFERDAKTQDNNENYDS